MSQQILVQMSPFDYYFFGGEETLHSGAKGLVNYHVKSNRLPQQTGVLGLLRHALFTMAPPIPIGKSFNGQNADFGIIEKISPLFLMNEYGKRLVPSPLNINPNAEPIQISLAQGTQKNYEAMAFLDNHWLDDPIKTEEFEPKKGRGDYWLNVDSGQTVAGTDIFKSKVHVGINKSKRIENNDDEGGFFKQEFNTLGKGYSFAFVATLSENIDIKKLPSQLPFGGERRTFFLQYKRLPTGWFQDMADNAMESFRPFASGSSCIILFSDAYTSQGSEVANNLLFGVMDESPFRNMITPEGVTHYGSYSRTPDDHGNNLYKSRLKYLLKRGSILFYSQANKPELTKALKHEVFQTIGYNHFFEF